MSQSSKRNQKAERTAGSLINAAQVQDNFSSCGTGNPSPILWNSAARNRNTYEHYLMWILDLAINRFKWVGLPDSCNVRFLEWSLLSQGMATFCRENTSSPILSLRAVPTSRLNVYGEPLQWRAYGYGDAHESRSLMSVNNKTGVLVYENISWLNPWLSLQIFANDLTQIHLTEMQNLAHQRSTIVYSAPDEYLLSLTNAIKNVAGYEPITAAYPNFMDNLDIQAIISGVPYIGGEMQEQKRNKWGECLAFLGIQHLAFEKGERMIQQEAEGNNTQTYIMLTNELKARQDGAKKANELFGTNISVSFNDDISSYNFEDFTDELTNQQN